MKLTYEQPTISLSPLAYEDVIKTSSGNDRDYTGDWDSDLD